MWAFISRLILRNRAIMLGILFVLTIFWGYIGATRIRLNHKFQTMLPKNDTAAIVYEDMKHRFGEDGMVMVIGINNKELYQLPKFQAWKKMGDDIKKVDGVDSVFSVAHMYGLYKSASEKKFELRAISPTMPKTQTQVDSIREAVKGFPFYDHLLYNDSTGASLMMVFINPEKFNSKERGTTIADVIKVTDNYRETFPDLHFSGLPYLRDVLFKTLQNELRLFVALSALVTVLIIFAFFRSIRVVIACMAVVIVGVIWSFGTIGLLGYEVSQLMALIPPLMIVIAIPNCIYLITKYHYEFIKTRNKLRSLSHVIQKIGGATFMTNATTALGFATFIFTNSDKLIEFGVIASINVMSLFILSVIIIPTILSFMKDPSVKQTKHLEKGWVEKTVDFLIMLASSKRWLVYVGTLFILGISVIGIYNVQTTGAITEDLPESSQVKKDLRYIEENFGGMVPFEIIIDFKRRGQIQQNKNLQKIDAIQEVLARDSVFSKSLSIVDATKFVNQAFYGGNINKYKLIERRDLAFIKPYFESLKDKREGAGVKGFIDSTETRARITTQVKDLGAKDLKIIEKRIQQQADSILNPDKTQLDSSLAVIKKLNGKEKDDALTSFYENFPRIYNLLIDELAGTDSLKHIELEMDPEKVYALQQEKDFDNKLKAAANNYVFDITFTGTAVAYAKGTHYLIGNLFTSLIFAIISISALMSLIFRSFRMVIISMVPNIVPLIITAAVMGFLGVPIKPSTILVFSIALGISVDDAIHYLAKYRQEPESRKVNFRSGNRQYPGKRREHDLYLHRIVFRVPGVYFLRIRRNAGIRFTDFAYTDCCHVL